jgi:hypothetical protein
LALEAIGCHCVLRTCRLQIVDGSLQHPPAERNSVRSSSNSLRGCLAVRSTRDREPYTRTKAIHGGNTTIKHKGRFVTAGAAIERRGGDWLWPSTAVTLALDPPLDSSLLSRYTCRTRAAGEVGSELYRFDRRLRSLLILGGPEPENREHILTGTGA